MIRLVVALSLLVACGSARADKPPASTTTATTTTTRPGIICPLPDGSQVITGPEEAKHLGCRP